MTVSYVVKSPHKLGTSAAHEYAHEIHPPQLKEVCGTTRLDDQRSRGMAVQLSFDPRLHGFHFHNSFCSHFAGGFPEVRTDGLCGGMALGAFNYFRYGLPIPPHIDADIDFNVSFDVLRTRPGTSDLIDYIFHSQVATFENISILAFIGPFDPSFQEEFGKVRARIDRGEYLILGLKMRHGIGGLGH